MHEVQRLEACPQAFAGGMGLSDRLKTLKNLWEAAERRDEPMGSRDGFGDRHRLGGVELSMLCTTNSCVFLWS